MRLFVYGTLKYPEIVFALTGKKLESCNAFLNDYRVIGLKNKPYPGIIESKGSIAKGKLLELDIEAFRLISDWEDVEYSLTKVIVETDKQKQIEALTFLHIEKSEQLKTDWNEEYFRKNHLEDYLQNRIQKYLSTNKYNLK